ncbi:hypothetical protein [Amycolatopsis sp. cmx-8-4]|uniref:hypothetical protein n=1 Tax=Amycolatopsis sp. cmx-8-4 TaxID=2790947 RepID=UPI0039785B38
MSRFQLLSDDPWALIEDLLPVRTGKRHSDGPAPHPGRRQRGRPLTPARPAERIALTTGATSSLLNRLEDARHIRHTREHSGRRIVTLHCTPAIHAAAEPVSVENS